MSRSPRAIKASLLNGREGYRGLRANPRARLATRRVGYDPDSPFDPGSDATPEIERKERRGSCSSDSPSGHGRSWFSPRTRRGPSSTTTSARSTSCSASSARRKVSLRASSSRSTSRWKRCAPRSRASSARATRSPPARSRSRRAPRRFSSWRCARPSRSATTTSARSTSSSASCARTRASPHASCSTSTRMRRRSATRSSACSRAQAGARRARASPPGEKTKSSKLLDQFGRNLTKAAVEGKLDPVVGRQTEIERVMQILSRRQKNNPVLIGEPGVGKTAVVEGLATRISSSQVPRSSRASRSTRSTSRRWSPARSTAVSSRSA